MFLVAAILPFGIMWILTDLGGVDGILYLLTPESGSQSLVAYLLELSVFLLAVTGLLFSPLALSKSHLMWLISLALGHALAGLAFASATVPPVVFALVALVYFYRKRNA